MDIFASRRTEFALLLFAVLATMTSLVLGALAGLVWFALPLAVAAVLVVVASYRRSGEPRRHRR
jgi:hypothetical protein